MNSRSYSDSVEVNIIIGDSFDYRLGWIKIQDEISSASSVF